MPNHLPNNWKSYTTWSNLRPGQISLTEEQLGIKSNFSSQIKCFIPWKYRVIENDN